METRPHWRLGIKDDYAALSEATRQMRAFLEDSNQSDKTIYALETTLEEMVTNAVKYGFDGVSEPRIDITLTLQNGRWNLVIEDNGNAFDPTQVPEPNKNRPLEEMPIGGLGIHLVRSLTESFEYSRSPHTNCLHVWLPAETARQKT